MTLEKIYFILAVIGAVADIISLIQFFGDSETKKGPAIIVMILGTCALFYGCLKLFPSYVSVPPEPVPPEPVSSELYNVGENIDFGSYPQTALGEYQPISWRVLDIQNDKALLISEKVLDSVKYNNRSGSVAWENCSLREWLNSDFYYSAFSSDEKNKIADSELYCPSNPKYNTYGGSRTVDKVFVLNVDEARKYFLDDQDRKAAATEYAKKRGSYVTEEHQLFNGLLTSWYWLRTPGQSNDKAMRVYNSGGIDYKGTKTDYEKVSVRPAIWVYM